MKIEKWKPVIGFEGLYEVSNYGNVRSVDRTILRKNENPLNLRGKMLPQYKYYGNSTIARYRVNLSKNCKRYTKTVSRLVAIAFIPNPYNLPQVNHKDENPSNNRVTNLEWCSNKYNHNYGTRNYRQSLKLNKKVNVFTLSHEFIREYDSLKAAANDLHIDSSSITKVCKGKYKYSGNYIFEYSK